MTTIEKIESYLLITIDENFKPKVQQFIDVVTAYIENYTGRSFTPITEETEATERVYSGDNSDELYIDDAVEVIEVKIGDEVLETIDFYLYPSNRLPKTRITLPYRIFTTGNQNVTVTAKWGFGEEIPADLSFAATVLVAGIINSQNTDEKDVQSETIGRYSVTYRSGSTQQHDFSNAKEILKMYKRYA
jgi:hypothetical protein